MDHVYLTGPQGTTIDVGSWIDLTRGGPDYGARDLIQQQYAQNALAEGGQFAYEMEPIRRMLFPLTVPSGGVGGLPLDTIESLLHLCARPGGYIDIQPEGAATSGMTRFDVIGGRVNHDPYTVPVQRAARRFLSLSLDTQPFGYWPTWITIGSAASYSDFGRLPLTIPRIGDVPGLLEFSLGAPSLASGFYVDGVAWALGGSGPAGVQEWPAFISGGSFAALGGGASVSADVNAFGGNNGSKRFPPGASGWSLSWYYDMSAPRNGRYRIWAQIFADATALPAFSADSTAADVGGGPLGSANPVATIPVASRYVYLDLGEQALPAIPSAQYGALRIWARPASVGATQAIYLGGVYLQPVDEAGVLPRGWAPTGYYPSGALPVTFHAGGGALPGGLSAASQAYNNYLQTGYQGRVAPQVGASITELSYVAFSRAIGLASAPPQRSPGAWPIMQPRARYRPRFRFLRGL